MSEELDRDLSKRGGPVLLSEESVRRRDGILNGGNSRGLLSFFLNESGDDVTDDRLPAESTLRSISGGIVADSVKS